MSDTQTAMQWSEINDLQHWVTWKRQGDHKPPFNADGSADVTDNRTWITRHAAIKHCQDTGSFEGVGLVMGPIGNGLSIGGIDVDLCDDESTGELFAWAQELVNCLETYTELSPSGNGIHILFVYRSERIDEFSKALGVSKDGIVFNDGTRRGNKASEIAVFFTNKYLTVTNEQLSGTPNALRLLERSDIGRLRTICRAYANHSQTVADDNVHEISWQQRYQRDLGKYPDLQKLAEGRHTTQEKGDNDKAVMKLCSIMKGLNYDKDQALEIALRTPGCVDHLEKRRAEGDWPRAWDRAWDRSKEWKPREPRASRTEDEDVISEKDAADMFVAEHGENCRFDHDVGYWFNWKGSHWKQDKTLSVFTTVMNMLAGMGTEAGGKAHAILGKASTGNGVEKIARGSLGVTTDYWDASDWLIACPGGVTVDLHDCTTRESSPADLNTKLASIAPDFNHAPVHWLKFIDEVCLGDTEMVDYLQMVAGYCLTGSTKEQCLFFLYGEGGNGKSVFVDTIQEIVGDYGKSAPMDTFINTKSEQHPTNIAFLRGARMVTATETDSNRTWAEATIKRLTGGDVLTARFMRQDFFNFKPKFKLLFMGNHQPQFRSLDEAMRRRFHMVPFKLDLPQSERDPNLPDRLRSEHAGIFAWMLHGCRKWMALEGRLPMPRVVAEETAEYFKENDTIGQWLEECCERIEDEVYATNADIYTSYTNFTKRYGYFSKSAKALSQELTKRGFARVDKIGTTGQRGFKYLKINRRDDESW